MDKRVTMAEIRKWYEEKYGSINEKEDIEDGQDVCDVIWLWEKGKWTRTQ